MKNIHFGIFIIKKSALVQPQHELENLFLPFFVRYALHTQVFYTYPSSDTQTTVKMFLNRMEILILLLSGCPEKKYFLELFQNIVISRVLFHFFFSPHSKIRYVEMSLYVKIYNPLWKIYFRFRFGNGIWIFEVGKGEKGMNVLRKSVRLINTLVAFLYIEVVYQYKKIWANNDM